jgi:hypothetical protein
MRHKVITVVFALLLLAPVPFLTSHRLRSASNHDSATSAPSPVASDSTPPPPREGCKLATYTGTIPLNKLQYYVAGEEDVRGGMTCTFLIHPKLPLFTFHFAGQADNTFGNLDITSGTSSEVIQTIENSTDPNAIAPAKAESALTVVDANFDGYKDLKLLSTCGVTGNCSYDFYLYDPRANEFVHNDFLSGLVTPSFDQQKKQVLTSSNSSVYDTQSETYRYENDGRYTLIRKEASTWDRDARTITQRTYEIRNGQMELVDSKTTPEPK